MTTMKQIRMEFIKHGLLEMSLVIIISGFVAVMIIQVETKTAHADPVLPECHECGCMPVQNNVILRPEAI